MLQVEFLAKNNIYYNTSFFFKSFTFSENKLNIGGDFNISF